jgi:low affinity Fe/Cu permease
MSTNPDLAEYQKKLNQGYEFLFKNPTYWNAQFDRFARIAAHLTGKPVAFNAAIFIIFIWVLSGPVFGFSDTWQLIINTATTIVTFLMVFLIQHTQNRDTEAVQVKLNEIIRAMDGAHNALLDLEELEEEELKILHQRYTTMAKIAREKLKGGEKDTDTPDILE